MRNARLIIAGVLCGSVWLAGIRIGADAPPPSPPAQGAIAVVTAAPPGAALPPPPAPIATPQSELPSFEVASVKKLDGRTTSSTLRVPGGGRITIGNLPLRTIIMQAFGIRDYQLIGAPGWLATDRFSITAKADTNAPRDQLMLMIRSLLVERFQMKYHAETREMPAYVLVVAGEEWKPSARMKPVDCSAARGARPPAGPLRPDQMPCGGISLGTAGITGRGVTLASFVSLLGSLGGLGVIHDRTGLTGTYQIELDASPTALLRSLSGASISSASPDNLLPSIGDGRSLGAAIEDLGLKLERRREPVEVLVIDSIGQPDED